MGGWMDGWMDGWVDGWMDGWMSGQTKRRTMHRHTGLTRNFIRTPPRTRIGGKKVYDPSPLPINSTNTYHIT